MSAVSRVNKRGVFLLWQSRVIAEGEGSVGGGVNCALWRMDLMNT